ncbi:MAG TPA: metallophosphoesterase [Bacteroidales bacterium]|nr:metallophosphoesterase [Bacteroidales bacterium]
MRDNPLIIILVIIVFVLLNDVYAFRGVAHLTQSFDHRQKLIIYGSFWLISLITVLWTIWIAISFNKYPNETSFRHVTVFFGFFILFYIPKFLFNAIQLVQDIGHLLAWLVSVVFPSGGAVSGNAEKISRSQFLIQIGLVLASIPFISIFYGIFFGKYNYKVTRIKLSFPNLPENFDGMRFIQFSDLHVGSFAPFPERLSPAIDIMNNLEADYVFFTGDLVNNIADEATEFIPMLQQIRPRKGKYAILGNHDYGEYYNWPSKEAHRENMEKLFRYEKEAGFTLLRNEHVVLREGDQEIALIGVENWGLPPFPQYGNLEKAWKPVKDKPFKILLSHDPSHWDAKVRPETQIDLTLSGHTHGMQFAIRIPGWRWSPVKFRYPRWAGLYTEGRQKLYVNIGLGFIAFPGRVGTPPEITLYELHRG